MPTRSTQAAPPTTWMPAASTAAMLAAITAISCERAFARTRVICSGSSRGATDARTTPNAFCSTSTPNAAGSSVSGFLTAADIA